MTGYTLGQRTSIPLSVMGLLSNSKVSNTSKSDDPANDFKANGETILPTVSVFTGGKITNNLGAFVQITHDRYADTSSAGNYQDTFADNMDFRYADHFIDGKRDLIWGISVNNNPSLADPWNTAAAWMQYVPVPSPGSSQFIDGTTPYPGHGSGGNLAGVTAYAFLNHRYYAEFGGYTTSKGVLKFMSAGLDDSSVTKLNGVNPYWRLAINHEWGAHSLMIGTSGMLAEVFDNPLDTSDPTTLHRYRDVSVDLQYQYLLDPHTVTAQLVFAHNAHQYPDGTSDGQASFADASGNQLGNFNAQDTTDIMRAKVSYVYQAKYGGSLAYFNQTGSVNTANQSSGFGIGTPGMLDPASVRLGNFSGDPAVRGWTLETFWMPTQYTRVGAQYTNYNIFNGASNNYDGFGRNAQDNNSLFIYLWAAY
ncbi:MAG: cytochrome C [Rhodoferax sp.]